MTTPTASKRVLVIAGKHEEAQEWARAAEMAPQDWVYVNSVKIMLGRRYSPYVCTGSYVTRADWPEIRTYLEIIEAVPYQAG